MTLVDVKILNVLLTDSEEHLYFLDKRLFSLLSISLVIYIVLLAYIDHIVTNFHIFLPISHIY